MLMYIDSPWKTEMRAMNGVYLRISSWNNPLQYVLSVVVTAILTFLAARTSPCIRVQYAECNPFRYTPFPSARSGTFQQPVAIICNRDLILTVLENTSHRRRAIHVCGNCHRLVYSCG